MAEPVRVELDGALEGHYILVDVEEVTFGQLEDLQGNSIATALDSLASMIVGGDLPGGVDRDGLRKLKRREGQCVLKGVGSALQLSKS